MPAKLGTITKKFPFSKIYLGSVLKYQRGSASTGFSVCPFPTSWTSVNEYLEFTSTNDYGAWNIITDGYSSTKRLSNVFDGDVSTYFRTKVLTSDTETSIIDIICPKLICPQKIYIKYSRTKNASIQGFNPNTNEWEVLKTLSYSSTSDSEETIELTTKTFYSKFRLETYRYGTSGSTRSAEFFEFQIQSGSMKEA
jgi:hypothetical protein